MEQNDQYRNVEEFPSHKFPTFPRKFFDDNNKHDTAQKAIKKMIKIKRNESFQSFQSQWRKIKMPSWVEWKSKRKVFRFPLC